MHKLLPSLIPVRDIECPFPREQFSEVALEIAARNLLKISIINPIVTEYTDEGKYRLIDGIFEYYAALKAWEIDEENGELINAYVAESQEEVELLQQQIEIFRHRETQSKQSTKLEVSQRGRATCVQVHGLPALEPDG